MEGTTYIYEPEPIPIDNQFSIKSGLTTDEAVLIKDYMIYCARDKAKNFYTTSEIIMEGRRAEQKEKERKDKEWNDSIGNLDWFKVAMAIGLLLMAAKQVMDYISNHNGY